MAASFFVVLSIFMPVESITVWAWAFEKLAPAQKPKNRRV
jgi:hypothetical protein